MKNIFSFLLFMLISFPMTSLGESLKIRWKNDLPTTKAGCLVKYGRWGKVGIPGNSYPPECRIFTKDSGKICYNSEDCEGYCLVENIAHSEPDKIVGKCSSFYPIYGCVNYLQDGEVIEVCKD